MSQRIPRTLYPDVFDDRALQFTVYGAPPLGGREGFVEDSKRQFTVIPMTVLRTVEVASDVKNTVRVTQVGILHEAREVTGTSSVPRVIAEELQKWMNDQYD